MIEVEEIPGSFYNWKYLLEHQEEWTKEFGEIQGLKNSTINANSKFLDRWEQLKDFENKPF